MPRNDLEALRRRPAYPFAEAAHYLGVPKSTLRAFEREALKYARVAAFVFTGGQASAADTADAVVPPRVKFANMAVSEPRPILYTFGSSGSLSRVRL